jgi:hypothetical protein
MASTQAADVTANGALTRDLLLWIDAEPRTYVETIDVWRTSCPRLSVWEDAVIAGLVDVRSSQVRLSARGRAALSAG